LTDGSRCARSRAARTLAQRLEHRHLGDDEHRGAAARQGRAVKVPALKVDLSIVEGRACQRVT